MEGVNMPASFKFAWRWLVGATAATIVSLIALPGVGQATNIEICINNTNGRIKGINLGIGGCTGNRTELDWVTTGPAGPTGLTGVIGDPGLPGTQGQAGYKVTWDLREGRGTRDRRVHRALSAQRDLRVLPESWVRMESAGRPVLLVRRE